MTYDDFSDKLREIKTEFETTKNTKLKTVEQLESYLTERKNRRKTRGVKSLKGLNI